MGSPITLASNLNGSLTAQSSVGATSWSATGPERYVNPSLFYDTFERTDQGINGSRSTSGHTWQEFHSTKESRISSGRLLFPHDGNNPTASYPGVVLPATPAVFGGDISWSGTTGLNACCVFMVGNDTNGYTATEGFPKNMLHIVCSTVNISINVYDNGTPGSTLYSKAISWATDGSPNHIEFELSGSTLFLRAPGGVEAYVTDSSIATGAGPICIFEPYYLDYPTQDYIPRFDAVYAGTNSSQSYFWLERGTTNSNSNPSAETNTTGISATRGTVTRVTSGSYDGSASFEYAVTSATGSTGLTAASGNRPAAVEGEVWSISAMLSSDVGMDVLPGVVWLNGGGSSISVPTGTAVGLVTGWRKVKLTATAPATTASVQPFWYDAAGQVGEKYWADAVQFERSPFPTSYTSGTRADGQLSISPASLLVPSKGAIAFKAVRLYDTGVEEVWGGCGTKGASTDRVQWGVDSSDHPFVEWSSNNAAYSRTTGTGIIPTNVPCDWYLSFDGTAVRLVIDAGTADTGTRGAVQGNWGAGNLTMNATTGSASFGAFATFNRTLTSREIAVLDNKPLWFLSMLGSNASRSFQLRPVSQ